MVTPDRDPSLIIARFLETTLNAALRAFHPRATITKRDRGPEHGWISGLTVSLYCCCCLELFNHIAEEASYRRCQNDRCNRLFVRQKGRAEAGQHRREGLKYCSNYCARAVAQRSYRARQRRVRKPVPEPSRPCGGVQRRPPCARAGGQERHRHALFGHRHSLFCLFAHRDRSPKGGRRGRALDSSGTIMTLVRALAHAPQNGLVSGNDGAWGTVMVPFCAPSASHRSAWLSQKLRGNRDCSFGHRHQLSGLFRTPR